MQMFEGKVPAPRQIVRLRKTHNDKPGQKRPVTSRPVILRHAYKATEESDLNPKLNSQKKLKVINTIELIKQLSETKADQPVRPSTRFGSISCGE